MSPAVLQVGLGWGGLSIASDLGPEQSWSGMLGLGYCQRPQSHLPTVANEQDTARCLGRGTRDRLSAERKPAGWDFRPHPLGVISSLQGSQGFMCPQLESCVRHISVMSPLLDL